MSNDQHASPLVRRIRIARCDITELEVDVVVNAANAALCGGGGVDGAIHRAAGPGLLAECRTLGGARPGEVRLTGAHRLRARFIAHAIGPVWDGGGHGEDELLARCYRRSLELLRENGLATIAFPAISTGAYRFPLERATRIALLTVREFLERDPGLNLVTFCCFSARDEAVYRRVAKELF